MYTIPPIKNGPPPLFEQHIPIGWEMLTTITLPGEEFQDAPPNEGWEFCYAILDTATEPGVAYFRRKIPAAVEAGLV